MSSRVPAADLVHVAQMQVVREPAMGGHGARLHRRGQGDRPIRGLSAGRQLADATSQVSQQFFHHPQPLRFPDFLHVGGQDRPSQAKGVRLWGLGKVLVFWPVSALAVGTKPSPCG